ncbi:MAG: nucleoside hydrolase, partial [Oscillospiraceae bacterium]|nr:nucleoside hydrolase [Oscillospiraceae bacterium]
MDKRKVIFDGDTGTDDAVALIALLLADNVDVIGITSVHGNRPVNNTTDNNLRVVQFLGKDVPVYK